MQRLAGMQRSVIPSLSVSSVVTFNWFQIWNRCWVFPLTGMFCLSPNQTRGCSLYDSAICFHSFVIFKLILTWNWLWSLKCDGWFDFDNLRYMIYIFFYLSPSPCPPSFTFVSVKSIVPWLHFILLWNLQQTKGRFNMSAYMK